MKRGFLSSYFAGVGAKRVTTNEIEKKQHEFQGVKAFSRFVGEPGEKREIGATYVWLDDEESIDQIDSTVTWYDSRKGQARRDPEGRFYYPAKAATVVRRAQHGDILFVCLRPDGSLLFILTPADSSARRQLEWLFGVAVDGEQMTLSEIVESSRFEIGFAARYILESLGIVVEDADEALLKKLVSAFGSAFPSTAVFSTHARKLAHPVDIVGDPDGALIAWIDLEYRLFQIFERHLIEARVGEGFIRKGGVDVEAFLSFSQTVHQRRKSRAGFSLENHLKHLFEKRGLTFQYGARTERKKKPDFLFPDAKRYHDPAFPAAALTLLGAKSTCKDRWRQVVTEGDRVEFKHLLTVEPGISEAQTEEMRSQRLSLVLPRPLHETYTPSQQASLLSVAQFIALVEERAKFAAS